MDQQDFFANSDPISPVANKQLFIGTSGCIFDDWRGVFYPEKLPKSRWLEFYSSQFSVVEINVTYYRLPPRTTFESMVARTPDLYPFWIKVPGEVTHQHGDLSAIMASFKESIAPLLEARKLAGVLAQFPFSFRPVSANLERISRLRQECEGVPLAVEIRNDVWQTERFASFFRDNEVTYVIPDLPKLPGLPQANLLVTSKMAYIRFHGRNNLTWCNPAMGDRYDYDYSSSQLEEWVPHISSLACMAESTYIFFNNCHMGQAIKNAKMLRKLLQNEFGDNV